MEEVLTEELNYKYIGIYIYLTLINTKVIQSYFEKIEKSPSNFFLYKESIIHFTIHLCPENVLLINIIDDF